MPWCTHMVLRVKCFCDGGKNQQFHYELRYKSGTILSVQKAVLDKPDFTLPACTFFLPKLVYVNLSLVLSWPGLPVEPALKITNLNMSNWRYALKHSFHNSYHRYCDWLIDDWLSGWSVDWLVGLLDGWMDGQMAGWLAGWMGVWLFDWLVGRLIACLLVCLIGCIRLTVPFGNTCAISGRPRRWAYLAWTFYLTPSGQEIQDVSLTSSQRLIVWHTWICEGC